MATVVVSVRIFIFVYARERHNARIRPRIAAWLVGWGWLVLVGLRRFCGREQVMVAIRNVRYAEFMRVRV